VDEILIWIKDPMAIIKSSKVTYMLKSVEIPGNYLGGNVKFVGKTWKNQGLGLALSEKTYIQNIIPKFERLFGNEFKPIKTTISEVYHHEVDDSLYATSTMSRFNMLPRERKLKAVERMLPK
jgi:hypothetical protein